jgi:hypothetical protein
MSYKTKAAALVACMLAIGVAFAPQNASAQELECGDVPPPQQTAFTRPIQLGISGGNINALIKNKKGQVTACTTGTLGSMVEDSDDNEYILSNNHVLADVNMAKPGQLIVQPGLADAACVKAPSNAVATFSSFIRVRFNGKKNFVDAAIAAVQPGDVSPDILFIGPISGTVDDAPSIGMPVQKMGRTTCLTGGNIQALDANILVNYSHTAKPQVAKFLNQFTVIGNIVTPTFASPGDSGSLIVTLGDCPMAVALLFAGSSNGAFTYANPISEVLSRLDVSMVGSCTEAIASETPGADASAANVGLSKEVVASAKAVRDRHEDQLMNVPGAVGSAIGAGEQPGQPAIVVYVNKLTPQVTAAAPTNVEGTPVKLIETGDIVAY